MKERGFTAEQLPGEKVEQLREMCRQMRGDILKMTTLAASGHPGGAMSSTEIYAALYSLAAVDPSDPHNPGRDRIVIGHGHTSAGVYSALGRLGFFDIDNAVATFRKTNSVFEGHVERDVPGVEWSSGNLGQGLSAACGFALASRITGADYHVFCVMGDGGQVKGQVSEAMRVATKFNLSNLTAIIDHNQIQISGRLNEVMPQNIRGNYEANGWEVLEIDGHDIQAVYKALRRGVTSQGNVCILANTIIGKGVSFMEDTHIYHGKTLSEEDCGKALAELGLDNDLEEVKKRRESAKLPQDVPGIPDIKINVETGTPRMYGTDEKTDNRSAYGAALKDIGIACRDKDGATPIAVVDCDLASSVKTDGFGKEWPENFLQVGIQEHNAATITGALSVSGVVPFFSDFGVFGVDETYNQHRLNDINHTNIKLVCTHNGLDVGEDGKTHQCIDYVGILANLYGYKVIVPADPNQTDRAVRYAAANVGNVFIGMGRSKLFVVTDEKNEPLFGGDYLFEYGKADVVREGSDAAILAIGSMVSRAIDAREMLKSKGITCLLLNVSCPLDLDENAIRRAASTGVIVTCEDHNVRTGLGSIVAGFIAENGLSVKFKKLGVSGYSRSGKPDDLYREQGLDPESVAEAVRSLTK